jgi:hypothetical protein
MNAFMNKSDTNRREIEENLIRIISGSQFRRRIFVDTLNKDLLKTVYARFSTSGIDDYYAEVI